MAPSDETAFALPASHPEIRDEPPSDAFTGLYSSQDLCIPPTCAAEHQASVFGKGGLSRPSDHFPSATLPIPTSPSTPNPLNASTPVSSKLPTIHSDDDNTSSSESASSPSPQTPPFHPPSKPASLSDTSHENPRPRVGSDWCDVRRPAVPTNVMEKTHGATPMKRTASQDSIRRLSSVDVHRLTATPDSLPFAIGHEPCSPSDRSPSRRLTREDLEALRESVLQPSNDIRLNRRTLDGPHGPPIRTVSTPPTTRRPHSLPESAPHSPRRNSFHPTNYPASSRSEVFPPLQLGAPGFPPSRNSDSFIPSRDHSASSTLRSPMPPSIPVPPMSIPTHLQLELAAQRPSPLYVYQVEGIDTPYESSAVKFERLMNFLLLPTYLERTLYFGALACLDAWLYNFTILPIRFLVALGVLVRWWAYVILKEIWWVTGFVWSGLGRLWTRGWRSKSRLQTRGRTANPLRENGTENSRSRTVSEASMASESMRSDRFRADSKASSNGTMPYGGFGQAKREYRVLGHRRTKSVPSNLSAFHKADLLQGAIIICSSLALMKLDASRMYHFIRAQSDIKLYVIFNLLEVGDRLLSSLGQDLLECLFSAETLARNPSGRSKVLLPLGMFVLTLIYNIIHSITLYFQVITLNVAVNSYSNALLTLLMSNQFVEVKSTVFKRIEKDNLFQLTCADIVERFQIWIMLLIIGMRNIVEVGGLSVPGAGSGSAVVDSTMPLHSASILPHSFTVLPSWLLSGEVLSPFVIVLGSEMLVDSIKHAYVNKFNNIKPTFYGRILDILTKDYYTNAFVTPSLTRRLGLPVIPLSCLFIRATIQTYHMFLSTHLPAPMPISSHTALSEKSAVPSSPAMIASFERLDAKLRDALGRSVYGPSGIGGRSSRAIWEWTSDDAIAALTMVVVFFLLFLVLLLLKLLLGMILLHYSRNRYAKMREKEQLVAQGKAEKENYDAQGKRCGGHAEVEIGETRRRWIHADEKEGLKRKKGGERDDDYSGVSRYEMVAKRIW